MMLGAVAGGRTLIRMDRVSRLRFRSYLGQRISSFSLFFPQRKCYMKTQYVKMHESESDLVGAKAAVGDR